MNDMYYNGIASLKYNTRKLSLLTVTYKRIFYTRIKIHVYYIILSSHKNTITYM